MKLLLDETLADSQLEAAILRLKKQFPGIPLNACADFVGHLLRTLDIPEVDVAAFIAEQLAEAQEDSDEFDGLPVDHIYQIEDDLSYLADYPPHWAELPPGKWVDELP